MFSNGKWPQKHQTKRNHILSASRLLVNLTTTSNYDAPITKMLEEGITVLDSGCGPAAWTLDMAVTFPKSKFHGVDISSVFPDSMKPDNVEFLVGNVAQTLPYPDNTFDYIHQRLLMAGLTSEDWSNVGTHYKHNDHPYSNSFFLLHKKALKELYRILKPGGYIELAEVMLKL
jgi:ubiquinone/menaquinone biosynthesis C-methylase UbiE